MRRDPIGFVRSIASKAQENDLSGLAAELSYRLFVASVPVFAFLAALGAIAANTFAGDNPAQTIVESLGDELPSDVASTVETQLSNLIEASGIGALLGAMAAALWTGSLAMGTVVKSLDRIHGAAGERSRIAKWFLVASLTVCAGVLLIGALIGLMLSAVYHNDLAEWVGLGAPSSAVVTFTAWAAAFVLVVAAATILYQAIPVGRDRVRWVTVGGIGFGLIWLIGSAAFYLYVSNFQAYPPAYGVLGAILLALGWLYFSSMAFLIGAQLDLAMHGRSGNGSAGASESAERVGAGGARENERPPRSLGT
jgi:membrane protein